MNAACEQCRTSPGFHAGLHVGHIWTETRCPAYRSGNGADCTCNRATCRHCQRSIVFRDGRWIDPEATGDDVIWREVCDAHDTFTAEHEPAGAR